MTIQLNSDFSHADVVITTTAPSGSLFTATDAAEKSEFCVKTLGNPADVMTYEKIQATIWRTQFQIVAMLMSDYRAALVDEEKELWKQRVLEVLVRMNATAQKFSPLSIPCDIQPPTAEYNALNVTGNWCLKLTAELTCLFTNVYHADILKIN